MADQHKSDAKPSMSGKVEVANQSGGTAAGVIFPDANFQGATLVFQAEAVVPAPPPVTLSGKLSRNVPPRNPFFTGRQDVLAALHSALAVGDAALVPEPHALTGLGGIGKTQTAVAYVHAYRNECNGVFWVGSESVEALQANLAGLAPELVPPVQVHAEQSLTLQEVYRWFETHSDWLLILDNADDLETLAERFPKHQTGRLLITTRASDTGLFAEPIEIAKFAPPEGATLLLRRARKLRDNQTLDVVSADVRQAALDLSDTVDGLPLALDQAGAYMAKAKITALEYLRLYREHGLKLLDTFPDRDHKSVTITYTLALQQAQALPEIGSAAAELLRLCAFLAPDNIPEELFTSGKFELNGLPAPLTDLDYIKVRAAVLAYSLVSRDAEINTLSVHRLLQEVVRQAMNAEERREWAERAVRAVNWASPNPEFGNWPLCDRLLPHWRTCAECIADYAIETAEASRLLHQAAFYLDDRAQYPEAEALWTWALAIKEKVYGAEHPETATGCNNLAALYWRQGRYAEAEPLYQRALAIKEKALGPEHPETATCLHNLAGLYTEQERFADAESLLQRALTIREQALGPQHPLTAGTLDRLAGVYRMQSRFAEAEPLLKRALHICETVQGKEHPATATRLHNLAVFYIDQQRYAEAQPFLARALAIRETHLGPLHPDTAHSLRSMAIVQWKLGQAAEAEAGFARARQIFEMVLGPQHPTTRNLLEWYAAFRKATGGETP